MSDEVMGSPPVKGSRNAARKCYEFGHRNNRGEPCGANVIRDTTGCVKHAGKTKAKAKAEGEIRREIRQWTLDGNDTTADPGLTLLQLIAYWRFRVNLYGQLLGEAYEAAERLRAAHESHALVVAAAGEAEETRYDDEGREQPERPALQVARADLDRIFNQGGVAALVGHSYSSSQGEIFATGERIRGLQQLEGEGSDRLARYCQLALAANVAERQVRLAERIGDQVEAVLRAAFTDPRMQLSPAQLVVVPDVIRSAVGSLLSGARPAIASSVQL